MKIEIIESKDLSEEVTYKAYKDDVRLMYKTRGEANRLTESEWIEFAKDKFEHSNPFNQNKSDD